MPDCKNCYNNNWKNQYLMAQERFDKVVTRLVIGTIIAFTISVFCLIATICVIVKFENFISDFEYVEETEVKIDQDAEGVNTAIIGNGSGVISYGAKNNC